MDMMWFELFGGFVHEAMKVFRKDLEEKGRPKEFDLGWAIADENFAQPELPATMLEEAEEEHSEGEDLDEDEMGTIDVSQLLEVAVAEKTCEDDEEDERERSDKPVFFFNPKYVKGLEEASGASDISAVMRAALYVKGMAIREVAYLIEGEVGYTFTQKVQDCMVKFEEANLNSSWSWFAWYKERVSQRYLREVQEGTKDHTLMKHVVALQTPANEGVSREFLQQENARMKRSLDELQSSACLTPQKKERRVRRA